MQSTQLVIAYLSLRWLFEGIPFMQLAYILLILSIGFFAGLSALIIYRSHQEAKKIAMEDLPQEENDKKNNTD